jgi:hypothetical protein
VKALLLHHSNPPLHPDDIEVTSSGAPGRDLKLSPAAQKQYPLAIEVKNVEKLNIREAYVQAIGHAKPGDRPCVFHTRNRDIMLVTLSAEDFLLLVKGAPETLESGARSVEKDVLRVQEAIPAEEP